MTCALYETDDGMIYVGRKTDDDDVDPPPLSPLFLSLGAARQWIAEHLDVCGDGAEV